MKPHRIILPTNGLVISLRALLYTAYPDYSETHVTAFVSNLSRACVEACRERGAAVTRIIKLVQELRSNILSSPEVSRLYVDQFCKTVKELGICLAFQMEELNLYDENGTLQYHCRQIMDPKFTDVALDHIQLLTWSGATHEPQS